MKSKQLENETCQSKEKIIIIGAGVSGLALALLLSRSGHVVSIYDKRTGFDKEVEGKSINFTISGRGLRVLDELGLKEKVIAQSVILYGRIVHSGKNNTTCYKYGTNNASHVLYSIRRSKLIAILLKQITVESQVEVFLGFELLDIEKSALVCSFFDLSRNLFISKSADCVIGADGVFSAVRNTLLKGQLVNYEQKVFDWAYKEFRLSSIEAVELGLKEDHLHMWPRKKALLVAIPNLDRSFSVIFSAPLFDAQGKEQDFNELVKIEYHDLVDRMSSFLNAKANESHNYLFSIKIDKWYIDDKIVLLGDASHATYPFYGQGMNSALEDALILNNNISNSSLSRLDAFMTYQKNRKKDTDALHLLSERHLYQMTKSIVSSFGEAKTKLDYKLATLFPSKWVYEYEAVAHSNMPYIEIIDIMEKQEKRKKILGFYVISCSISIFIWLRKMVCFLTYFRF